MTTSSLMCVQEYLKSHNAHTGDIHINALFNYLRFDFFHFISKFAICNSSKMPTSSIGDSLSSNHRVGSIEQFITVFLFVYSSNKIVLYEIKERG